MVGFSICKIVALNSFNLKEKKNLENNKITVPKQNLPEFEEKQKEIIDSIKYAKRIQQSQLPTNKYIEKSIGRLRKG